MQEDLAASAKWVPFAPVHLCGPWTLPTPLRAEPTDHGCLCPVDSWLWAGTQCPQATCAYVYTCVTLYILKLNPFF